MFGNFDSVYSYVYLWTILELFSSVVPSAHQVKKNGLSSKTGTKRNTWKILESYKSMSIKLER